MGSQDHDLPGAVLCWRGICTAHSFVVRRSCQSVGAHDTCKAYFHAMADKTKLFMLSVSSTFIGPLLYDGKLAHSQCRTWSSVRAGVCKNIPPVASWPVSDAVRSCSESDTPSNSLRSLSFVMDKQSVYSHEIKDIL